MLKSAVPSVNLPQSTVLGNRVNEEQKKFLAQRHLRRSLKKSPRSRAPCLNNVPRVQTECAEQLMLPELVDVCAKSPKNHNFSADGLNEDRIGCAEQLVGSDFVEPSLKTSENRGFSANSIGEEELDDEMQVDVVTSALNGDKGCTKSSKNPDSVLDDKTYQVEPEIFEEDLPLPNIEKSSSKAWKKIFEQNLCREEYFSPEELLQMKKDFLDAQKGNGDEIQQLPNSEETNLVRPEKTTFDVGVQVSAADFDSSPFFVLNLKTDAEVSTATGIQSLHLLNNIVKMTEVIAKPDNAYKIKLRDRIIMTFIKLKQNVSYAFLALLFPACSSRHCQRIVFETVQLLRASLQVFVEWPGREELRKNIPQCFANFIDVAVVLDCTEIFVQHPSNLTQQIVTYSYYKGDNTWKFMTGVSPAGNLINISRAYGGRVSDKTIFEQSYLLDQLDPGDSIMVDRGFLVDEICDRNRVKVIRPPFLHDKKQFTKQEALLTAEIARARVHVERANQRIKVFKVLGEITPGCLTPILEDIFIVACAVVNLSSPILAKDKFMR